MNTATPNSILYGEHTRSYSPVDNSWTPEGSLYLRRFRPVPAVLNYPLNSLLLIAGLPGAGKSALIKRCLGSDFEYLSVAAEIDRMGAVFKKNMDPGLLGEAFGNMLERVCSAPRDQPVVVETTALRFTLRNNVLAAAFQGKRAPHLLLVSATAAQAREGQQSRGHELPENTWRLYQREDQRLKRMLAQDQDYLVSEGWASSTVSTRWAARSIQQINFA